jgi:hypothetical protein
MRAPRPTVELAHALPRRAIAVRPPPAVGSLATLGLFALLFATLVGVLWWLGPDLVRDWRIRGEAVAASEVRIEQARELEGDDAVALARQVAEQSLAKHTYSAYLPATVALADALRRAGQFDQAVAAARALVDQFATRAEIGMYPPECWWLIHQALDAGGDRAGARAALHRGAHWVQATAEARVPDEFRSSFLERNPVNRGLLTTLTRTP